jgi:hypothetical protein
VGFEPTVTLPPQWFQERWRFGVRHGYYLGFQHVGLPRHPRSSRAYPVTTAAYLPGHYDEDDLPRLLLLSPLLSTRRRLSSSKPVRTLQGMARVRSGQAPAWPLSSVRSDRRDSRIKRDFACTCARHISPVLVALRSQSRLMLEGRARTLSGPSPDHEPSKDFCIFRPHANRDYHAGHGHLLSGACDVPAYLALRRPAAAAPIASAAAAVWR